MKRIYTILSLLSLLLITGFSYAQISELFISEYIEGSSNNKAIEIYNGTGSTIDLTAGGYKIEMYFNGAITVGLSINLSGTVANNDVFVLANGSANPTILAQADQTNSSGWYNGDDAVVLRKGSTIIDVIGQIGFDPGTEWGTGLVSTADNTLRRKSTVCAGDTDGSNAFDPSSQWDGYVSDNADGLGSHSASCTVATPTVSATPTTLTGFTYQVGNGPSAGQMFSVSGSNLTANVTITPPSNYEISTDGTTYQSTAITLTQSGGTVGSTTLYARLKASLGIGTHDQSIVIASTDATSVDVVCQGEVTAPPSPTLSVSPATLSAMNYYVDNGPSTSKWFSVTGANLTANVTVTPPANYQISTNNITFQSTPITLNQAAGTLSSTNIYVRLKAGLAVNTYNESITISSTDAADKTVACSGQVSPPLVLPVAWINEIHYDNVGTDENEMVEIVIKDAGDFTLSDFSVVLYNGSGGVIYTPTYTLDQFTAGSVENDYSVFSKIYPVDGIQNGAPDGLALVWQGHVIQFLSYEGSFTATNGPANGMVSTDIGIAEGSDAAGRSLQLVGAGFDYADFFWYNNNASPGAMNTHQYFGNPPTAVPVNIYTIFALFFLLAIGVLIRNKIL